ncbi:hypothetical protein GQ53DRAFT_307756 [Thozetella sp. PMI_491]|nr:hypothetical protein GQ53DRAFT_307756 [Thozetella sp. PMI_491]
MVSFRTTILALASALMVAADYYVEPTSVPLATRQAWCASETSSCPIICNQISTGPPITNTCDAETLTYGCLCANNMKPNVSEYSLTLPFFVCQAWGTQCVAACGNNNACQSDCTQNHPCGALNPTRTNTTSTTSSAMSATASASSSNTIFGTFDSGDSGNKNSAPALQFGSTYGLAVLAGSFLAGFFMML